MAARLAGLPLRSTVGKLLAVAATVAFLAQSVAPALAQDAPAPAQPTAGWTVNCAGAAGQADLVCTLVQTLVVKENGQRVLAAVVVRRQDGLVLNLGLPHGLDLAKGVDLSIDEGERARHPIVTADEKGSYAMIALDDALLAALKKGRLLNVAVSAYGGDEIILRLSLAGFTAGLARL